MNAYLQGFCKTAEAYGFSPTELIKAAAPMKKQDFDLVRRAFALGKNTGDSPTTRRGLAGLLGLKTKKAPRPLMRAARDGAAEFELDELRALRDLGGFDLNPLALFG